MPAIIRSRAWPAPTPGPAESLLQAYGNAQNCLYRIPIITTPFLHLNVAQAALCDAVIHVGKGIVRNVHFNFRRKK